MKILFITMLLSTSLSFAQDHSNHEAVAPTITTTTTTSTNDGLPVGGTKKKAEKNVRTNGKISTAGCETASGKTLAENDFGYADCVKQIGLKKTK